MEECKICFYEIPKIDLFDLRCCGNRNQICKYCIDLLTVPLCPFCRCRIEGLPDRQTSIRWAVSLGSAPLTGTDLWLLDPLDDSFVDSRILRRRMKRLRKIQERERQAEENRRLNYALNETRRQSLHEKRQDTRRQIQEDVDIFSFEAGDDFETEDTVSNETVKKKNIVST